jgi:hypothetical protein
MRSYSLDDKYLLERGIVYMTGSALVRVPIDQMRRDRRAGLNTGLISAEDPAGRLRPLRVPGGFSKNTGFTSFPGSMKTGGNGGFGSQIRSWGPVRWMVCLASGTADGVDRSGIFCVMPTSPVPGAIGGSGSGR